MHSELLYCVHPGKREWQLLVLCNLQKRVLTELSGPLPTTEDGIHYILRATDYYLIKWPEAYAFQAQSAGMTAK